MMMRQALPCQRRQPGCRVRACRAHTAANSSAKQAPGMLFHSLPGNGWRLLTTAHGSPVQHVVAVQVLHAQSGLEEQVPDL